MDTINAKQAAKIAAKGEKATTAEKAQLAAYESHLASSPKSDSMVARSAAATAAVTFRDTEEIEGTVVRCYERGEVKGFRKYHLIFTDEQGNKHAHFPLEGMFNGKIPQKGDIINVTFAENTGEDKDGNEVEYVNVIDVHIIEEAEVTRMIKTAGANGVALFNR